MLSIIELGFFAIAKLKDLVWKLLGKNSQEQGQESENIKDYILEIKKINDKILELKINNLGIKEEISEVKSEGKNSLNNNQMIVENID